MIGVPPWGSNIWAKVKQDGKLAVKAKKGMFVGIDNKSVGYQVYWQKKQKITIEQNIAFNKEMFGEPQTTHLEGETDISKPSIVPKPSPTADSKPQTPDPFDGPLTDIELSVDEAELPDTNQNEPNPPLPG